MNASNGHNYIHTYIDASYWMDPIYTHTYKMDRPKIQSHYAYTKHT